jgi:hypothetical protein
LFLAVSIHHSIAQSLTPTLTQLNHTRARTRLCRPNAARPQPDANDAAQFAELKTQGELTRRAWEKNVQVGGPV